MQAGSLVFHLLCNPAGAGTPPAAQAPPPVRLGPGVTALSRQAKPPAQPDQDPASEATPDDVLLEPFSAGPAQLRLLACFPSGAFPIVNGEPAPTRIVLAAGDCCEWPHGVGFRVALFHRPQIGPPPAGKIGEPCRFCRVPLVASATTYTCACGVVLHCEPDPERGLQCAQMNHNCPVCKRPIVLTEGYVTPHDED